MLVELLNFFSDSYGPLRVFDYLSFRAIFSALTALFISLVLGPRFINKMQFQLLTTLSRLLLRAFSKSSYKNCSSKNVCNRD